MFHSFCFFSYSFSLSLGFQISYPKDKMPFLFTHLCDLLSILEELRGSQDPPMKRSALSKKSERRINRWFQRFRLAIDSPSTNVVAILSCLFPHHTNRVNRFRPHDLSNTIGSIMGIRAPNSRETKGGRMLELQLFKRPGCGTLAQRVEVLCNHTFNKKELERECLVTVEEVYSTLKAIASYTCFSGQKVRQELGSIYGGLSPRHSKWFTRIILKNLAPIELPLRVVLANIHILLPIAYKVRHSFAGAISTISDPSNACGTPRSLRVNEILPELGIMVGVPVFLRGHSLNYVVDVADGRRMGLERKYDGEYCQIHVQRKDTGYEIQIFSKSGKDSTMDRIGIHKAIEKCLRLGKSDCTISHSCILVGELLPWSNRQKRILPFHALRRHVRKSVTQLAAHTDTS